MSLGTDAGLGVQAAALIARGRPEGARLVAGDLGTASRSFWAIALCVPAFACLRLMDWTEGGVPAHPAHAFAADFAAYAIGWLAFAAASHPIAGLIGRSARWPRFVALWNWCNVIQYTLLVAAGLPGLFGAPEIVSETAELVAIGWSLWLEWYAARLTLELRPMAALGMVMVDISIGLFVAAVVGDLSSMFGG
jgi:hypothetical protein